MPTGSCLPGITVLAKMPGCSRSWIDWHFWLLWDKSKVQDLSRKFVNTYKSFMFLNIFASFTSDLDWGLFTDILHGKHFWNVFTSFILISISFKNDLVLKRFQFNILFVMRYRLPVPSIISSVSLKFQDQIPAFREV